MKITVLGCGGSAGVPLITGDWGSCDPDNPKNRRSRSSILVEVQGLRILIDSSPDLRQQILKAQISHIDAVLYTHYHADHIYGLHELRYLRAEQSAPLPLYGDPITLNVLKSAFDYAFMTNHPLYPPFVKACPFDDAPFFIQNLKIIPFAQDHASMTTWGFRMNNFAYSTDFKTIPEESLHLLENLDLWMLDCLQFEEHCTHSHFEATRDLIRKMMPKRAILMHMNHTADYNVLKDACDPGTEPAFDGMIVVC